MHCMPPALTCDCSNGLLNVLVAVQVGPVGGGHIQLVVWPVLQEMLLGGIIDKTNGKQRYLCTKQANVRVNLILRWLKSRKSEQVSCLAFLAKYANLEFLLLFPTLPFSD